MTIRSAGILRIASQAILSSSRGSRWVLMQKGLSSTESQRKLQTLPGVFTLCFSRRKAALTAHLGRDVG